MPGGPHPARALPGDSALGGGELVVEHDLLGDRALARTDELLEFLHGGRRRRARRRGHDSREQGQHAGVEAVGLGQDAVRLGEQAHAQRIDHGDREAGGVQAAAQETMPFAGGLDGHEPDLERRQPALEGADAGGRIGHPHRHPGRQDVRVEPAFANVDSDARLDLDLLFERFLTLHTGLAPHHLFRTRAEGRADPTPRRCVTPGPTRSRPPASGPVATGPEAPLSLHRVGARNMQGRLGAKPRAGWGSPGAETDCRRKASIMGAPASTGSPMPGGPHPARALPESALPSGREEGGATRRDL